MRVAGKNSRYDDEGETNELMSESYSRRSWKGIAIAFLVMGAVAAIVTLIVVYSGPQTVWSRKGTLTLDDVINNKYAAKGFGQVVWVEEDKFLYLDKHMALKRYDITKNETSPLLDNTTWAFPPTVYYPSPSNDYLIYAYNQSNIYRYSFNASYQLVYLKDIVKKRVDINNKKPLQLVSWGPNDQLVYVYENNVYYISDVSNISNPVKVTTDGITGKIFNGIPDWVYEEEVLSSASAIWWSKNGSHFAFMKFNDSHVKDIYMVNYGNYDQVYPSLVDIKYPKPGTPNPIVSMHVVTTSNPSTPIEVQPGTELTNLTDYIYGAVWPTDDSLCVVWMPRIQNQSHITLCSASDHWNCSMISEEKSQNGWVDGAVPYFTSDKNMFFSIKPFNGNYKHLIFFNGTDQNSYFVTNGAYEVTSIEYYDNNNRTVYYIRTATDGPSKRQLYMHSLIDKTESCLSCSFPGCSWASVNVGPNGGHYALTCSDYLTVPIVRLINMKENKLVQVWENNEKLKEELAKQVLTGKPLDYEVPVGDFKIKVRVFTPEDFDAKTRYGALIYVYGGPMTQMVQDRYVIDFGTYLASVKNVLYVEVDGRGSGFRGNQLMFQLYKRLGTVEIEDQINAMRYLLRNHTYVDPKRVAVWGWSYGGYAAAMTMMKGNETFRCGMSVAPVTSWMYYDSIYTERYMLPPSENLNSYKTSQLMNYVSNFKDKQFLLLHGTQDDNVHIQQTMMLTKALNNASILFNMHVYPDEAHSLQKSKLHVYRTLEQFLDKCFSI